MLGLPLLAETNERGENSLYPFVNLLPDGNIFVFANHKFSTHIQEKQFARSQTCREGQETTHHPALKKHRLVIVGDDSDKKLEYGDEFNIHVQSGAGEIDYNKIKVTMYSPPFTTHGYSMNQRLLILKLKKADDGGITMVAPPSGRLAPPGYHLPFVVHQDVPSRGMWVNIE